MNRTQKALNYYKIACMQITHGVPAQKPRFVPKVVMVLFTVRSDVPALTRDRMVARPGKYEVHANQYGAVSAKLPSGDYLGLKLNEFEVLEWQDNPAWEPAWEEA